MQDNSQYLQILHYFDGQFCTKLPKKTMLVPVTCTHTYTTPKKYRNTYMYYTYMLQYFLGVV